MPSDLGCYPFACVLFILLCLLLCRLWRRGNTTPSVRKPPSLKREPKPLAGLTGKPDCEACEQGAGSQPRIPGAPPPRMTLARGRHRQVDTSSHFCPHPPCVYQGWVGFGNLRANGHPNGRRWRQLLCLGCHGYFLETPGTLFHAKQIEPDRLVWAMAALAEGLGIRAVARVFAVDPNTGLTWLVEAAEHLEAFSRYVLHDVDVEQVQMDELFALLSAVKDGEVTEDEAIKRLSRSPHWVWVAMDPGSKLILTCDVGERTLAMAQRLVHQVTQVLAPACAPLFLTDGFRDSLIALVAHYGQWIQPERRQGKGPMPKPRWMPLPQLLYAQVVKSYRRRRLVGVKHCVVFGTREAIEQILAQRGWTINTAFAERLNLDLRQHVAAIGRRVNTLGKHEAGLRQQLALFHPDHNFVLPHASWRLPLPDAIHGTGSVKRWQQRTPAMAAGLTDRVWNRREVLM
jgi:IS1 family transposase